MTPFGHAKSVTVINCHSKQRLFTIIFIVKELSKVSLYPVLPSKWCNCNRLSLCYNSLIWPKLLLRLNLSLLVLCPKESKPFCTFGGLQFWLKGSPSGRHVEWVINKSVPNVRSLPAVTPTLTITLKLTAKGKRQNQT